MIAVTLSAHKGALLLADISKARTNPMDVFWDPFRQRRGAGHVLCAVLIGFIGCAPAMAAPDEFYAGKTITILTSGGGAYETYGRTFARYMPKYIPGRPAIIVQAMPGAGGARAASYLYRVAPRDGTVIGGLHWRRRGPRPSGR